VTQLDRLPADLALEVDGLCDDFERHWRRARQRGLPSPAVESFASRGSADARAVALACLRELERDLTLGVAVPDVPGYEVMEEIGRGGMGVVYKARRRCDGRSVALKLIPGEEHDRWSRWMAELTHLRHPHLVPLEGFGQHAGLHYLVMPYVPGGDLKERLGEFISRPVGRLILQVAEAVAHLHRHGIIHRDLKPSNVLLTPAPDPQPLVCDFGLAVRLGTSSGPAGTLAYAAPEQSDGRPMTPTADVWSLGALSRQLLAGRPGPLADIADRCLRPDPAERYASAAELADDLRRITTEEP
jgi:serine/threonine protein kinase